ncbi:hypothetical protein Btru_045100 [Bulinus truncatus]|nr:hypothetical protein Btru_045100 [Bulinus truncatus]
MYYIGLDDIEVDGTYRWHDDGSILDNELARQIYLPGEPNNYGGNEDCTVYYFINARLIQDCPCSWVKKYVCEKMCFR